MSIQQSNTDAQPKGKVLVLDDEESIVGLFKRYLSNVGYQVSTAFNGKEGLEVIAKEGLPDVVVTDNDMPHMSGIEFTGRLYETNPGAHTKVIFGSARLNPEMKYDAEKAGAFVVYQKPLENLSDLKLMVDNAYAVSKQKPITKP